ncbi:hypothetical protein COEREDRAFT_9807 [Coemansia reversa NRRL 1564]|uniref:SWI5-dependent HO expression protein 3 n=1 Tax=Coemansia reversa (strain ATCC 12441 / NRRL 1564) TaxID=763665 RepID=A0A2G5B7I3_COERN|nr:hypothetical protein COEREDRAFT_9807 [Coemansia reversa NRRL 1564]|eukprot:PIA14942.1 hypothetical protein COEREDRAFT_9807 [Coemansia reversa NRRL 1564]
MFIVSLVLARVRQLAETRPTVTPTNSEREFLTSQPKRPVVKHMTSNHSSYTLKGVRFGGFNTFNGWNIFANNWYANIVEAAQQHQALESKFADARNAAAEQNQQCETLKVELARTIETVTKERQKREELEAELQDMVETATEERQKREAIKDELKDALDTAAVERQKRKALEAKLVGACITAGGVKQRLDEDLQRACQRRQMLQLKIHDALNAAVGPNQQFELLDFKLIDVRDEIEELKRRHLTLEIAVEKGHEIVEYNFGDACKAMDEVIQQWDGRWEAMQREHIAENENLPAEIQLMSPPSTPHKSSDVVLQMLVIEH